MKLIIRAAFIIIAIAVIIAVILMISTGSQDESSDRPEKTVPQDSIVRPENADTLPDTVRGPDRPLPLPPGHARLVITIKEISEGRMTAEVHRVLGYGSSTKPIAAGQELSIDAGTYLQNSETDTADLAGSRREATVSMQQQLSLGEEKQGTEWVLERFHRDE